MNDKELPALLRSDPQRGLAKTVDIYSAYVLKIAHTRLDGICSREDIEDAVSDNFMAFYTSGQKCCFEIRSVTAFISHIAQRHCLNVFRKMQRQGENIPLLQITEDGMHSDTRPTAAPSFLRLKQAKRGWIITPKSKFSETHHSKFPRKR